MQYTLMFGIASRYVEAKSKAVALPHLQSRNFASNPTKSGDFAEQLTQALHVTLNKGQVGLISHIPTVMLHGNISDSCRNSAHF
jgi:hypothetical protein